MVSLNDLGSIAGGLARGIQIQNNIDNQKKEYNLQLQRFDLEKKRERYDELQRNWEHGIQILNNPKLSSLHKSALNNIAVSGKELGIIPQSFDPSSINLNNDAVKDSLSQADELRKRKEKGIITQEEYNHAMLNIINDLSQKGYSAGIINQERETVIGRWKEQEERQRQEKQRQEDVKYRNETLKTAEVRDWEFAVAHGYKGTFEQFIRDKRTYNTNRNENVSSLYNDRNKLMEQRDYILTDTSMDEATKQGALKKIDDEITSIDMKLSGTQPGTQQSTQQSNTQNVTPTLTQEQINILNDPGVRKDAEQALVKENERRAKNNLPSIKITKENIDKTIMNTFKQQGGGGMPEQVSTAQPEPSNQPSNQPT